MYTPDKLEKNCNLLQHSHYEECLACMDCNSSLVSKVSSLVNSIRSSYSSQWRPQPLGPHSLGLTLFSPEIVNLSAWSYDSCLSGFRWCIGFRFFRVGYLGNLAVFISLFELGACHLGIGILGRVLFGRIGVLKGRSHPRCINLMVLMTFCE